MSPTGEPDRKPAVKGTGPPSIPPRKTWLWFVLVLIVNFFLARLLFPGAEGPVTVPYTLFKDQVGKRNVQAIYSQGDTLTGRVTVTASQPSATNPRRGTVTTASEVFNQRGELVMTLSARGHFARRTPAESSSSGARSGSSPR